MIHYEFVPKYTGEYRFYTAGNLDTYGYLYDSCRYRLTYNDDNDDNDEGSNFSIVCNLTAGMTYYIASIVYNGSGTYTLVTETDCVEGTKTLCITVVTGEKNFCTIPSYLPKNAQIILTCYRKGNLVDTQYIPNPNEAIYFIVSETFDTAKIMVWDSFKRLKPLCIHKSFENKSGYDEIGELEFE